MADSAAKKAQDRLSAVAATLSGALWPAASKFPAFDDLPRIPGQPQGCIWGFYDRDGVKDEVGSLNLLTADVVKQAAREIATGQHIQLDWSLDNLQFPGFDRQSVQHVVIDHAPKGWKGMDDELHLNTQSGSQWDGFKHFAHQKSGMYYNGVPHEVAAASGSTALGINRWCERGGIVGRGVLVDWVRWHEHKHGTPPSPILRHEIPASELEAALAYQGTTTRPGDILLVRSGYVRWHNLASAAERKGGTRDQSRAIGVQANEATVRWLYDHHFAAVAGDTVTFEAWPPPFTSGWVLHEWLLVQWGTPIGEMWDLEGLSQKCEAEQRWSFFLTSAPLHVKGGVGSPPGAIAIF